MFRALIECNLDGGKKTDASQIAVTASTFIKQYVPHLYKQVFGLIVSIIFTVSTVFLLFCCRVLYMTVSFMQSQELFYTSVIPYLCKIVKEDFCRRLFLGFLQKSYMVGFY